MALTKPSMAVNIITSLATTSAERGLTEAAFKAKFDETPAAIKTYLNDTLTAEQDILNGTFATLTGAQTFTNKTLTSPKINEDVALTASATELNILDGATLSATELNYVDGVTSAIQTQIDTKENKLLSFVAVTASKTLALTDTDTVQLCNHATVAINLTVPPNSSVAFPIGTQIAVKMSGAAQVAVVAGSGVTINPSTKLKVNAVNEAAVLIKEDTDTWGFIGSIKA